ncbi:hypothetical protein, partial [Frigoribacterium sp. CFBP 13712]|uniref:hypothetical protein n=1 Tax=Frigoribacterium sp. CFBP 13712 TaxID=2775309 RepID=UPI00177C2FB4
MPDNKLGFVYSGVSAAGYFQTAGSAPVSIPGAFGSVSALEVPATELVRGETSELKFMVRNTQEHLGFAPKVVLTAPEGTTFPEQATASSRYKATTADGWLVWDGYDLKEGVVSNDGKTLTLDNSDHGITAVADRDYEYTVKVETAADALDVPDNKLGFVYSGVSSAGNFQTAGSAPVSIPGALGSVSALEVPATELVRGETSELKFMVRNT